MANDITKNPWVLDTAADITAEKIVITKMVWKPNAAANDLTVLDHEGGTKWDVDALAAAPAGNEFFDIAEPMVFYGFNLSVIDGGTLYVYFK